MKRSQISGGIILVVLGVLFLLNNFNIIDISNLWSVIVFGALTFFFLIGGSFFLTLLFGALLVNSVLTSIMHIDLPFWQYFLPVLVIVFGCYLIFKPRHNKYERQYAEYKKAQQEQHANGTSNTGGWQFQDYSQSFNFQSQQVDITTAMETVALKCNFGNLDISFLSNERTSGTIRLSVKANFSNVNIIVPKGWNIVYAYNNESFSQTDFFQQEFNPDMPTIEISQKLSFSEAKIINA
ncbi:LiaF transmembrane domain-containing protein [Culicoidibacter larvae]|uniref:LiaF transmembrane domain-containing protein n=1 Tax=Culicoidibacter larvae TaxID=2579976 RepID=A0A5R8QDF5_9FIRM|nr:hypothetical protein [Culicoidibacter larvae]TLG75261.1 hypothetical protein FEZ08_04235 [Culicoidibacter larvae]